MVFGKGHRIRRYGNCPFTVQENRENIVKNRSGEKYFTERPIAKPAMPAPGFT